jgi:hypothetical protein
VPSALRLRVGGLTLHVSASRPTRFLAAPAAYRPFLAARGGDIRLDYVEERPPEPRPEDLLFESEGVWRVHRHDGGLFYSFRTPVLSPPLYKAVAIDAGLTRGRLFFPPSERGRRPRFAADYPLDELLFQHRLARDGGLELHACGLFVGPRVALFCGQSGAGKSTTARLWRRHRPATRILSDDRIVLRDHGGRLLAYGTPWHGDGGFARNQRGELGAIFFLRQASRTAARRLGTAEAAALLLARAFPPPWDALVMGRALELCGRAAARVPCLELAFAPDRTAVDVVRQLLVA